MLLYTKPRTWGGNATKSATLSGAQGRTAASHRALRGRAARPECVARPGAQSLWSPAQEDGVVPTARDVPYIVEPGARSPEPGAWSLEPTPGGKGGELWRRQDGA